MLVSSGDMALLCQELDSMPKTQLVNIRIELIGQVLAIRRLFVLINNTAALPKLLIYGLLKLFDEFIPQRQVETHLIRLYRLHLYQDALQLFYCDDLIADLRSFQWIKDQELF